MCHSFNTSKMTGTHQEQLIDHLRVLLLFIELNILWYMIVVASITEIKTSYRGFETKLNPVFRTLVMCIEKLFAGVHER